MAPKTKVQNMARTKALESIVVGVAGHRYQSGGRSSRADNGRHGEHPRHGARQRQTKISQTGSGLRPTTESEGLTSLLSGLEHPRVGTAGWYAQFDPAIGLSRVRHVRQAVFA